MKKLAALVFAVVLGCASLALVAGCSGGGGGGGTDYSGHYSIVEVEAGGQTVSMSDLEAYGYKADDIMSIDLNADGSAKINVGDLIASFMGDEAQTALGLINAADMTWTATGTGVDLTVNGNSVSLTDDGGKLKLDANGTVMIFAKA